MTTEKAGYFFCRRSKMNKLCR